MGELTSEGTAKEQTVHPQITEEARKKFQRSMGGQYLEDLGLRLEDLTGKEILDVGAGTADFHSAVAALGIARVTSTDSYSWGHYTDKHSAILYRSFRFGLYLPQAIYSISVEKTIYVIYSIGKNYDRKATRFPLLPICE